MSEVFDETQQAKFNLYLDELIKGGRLEVTVTEEEIDDASIVVEGGGAKSKKPIVVVVDRRQSASTVDPGLRKLFSEPHLKMGGVEDGVDGGDKTKTTSTPTSNIASEIEEEPQVGAHSTFSIASEIEVGQDENYNKYFVDEDAESSEEDSSN